MVWNAHVADLLRRYAAVLSLEGADKFKLRAYRRAAETIEGLHQDVAKLAAAGTLTDLPGIGKAISEIVAEIVTTGKLARLEAKAAALPTELAEIGTRPALDPKVVARVYKKLGIASLRELQDALTAGRIRQALGSRIELHVRRGLDDRPRHLLWSIEDFAESVEHYLQALPEVAAVARAGSLRRKQDTVGDLNFVVTGKSASAIFKRFEQFGAVLASEARGPNDRIFKMSSGISVNLRWSPSETWGLALVLATGSAAHVARLHERATEKKLKLTPAALRAKGVDCSKEAAIYTALGLSFVPSEAREDRGEVELAANKKFPKLITVADIRGDLHMHTTASDGANTIAEMAAAARERGYEYIAITDHSQSLKITNGLTEKRLRKHIKEIDKLNSRMSGLRILKSAEVDILEDGRLDYSDSMLKQLDFTICSIHSRFALNKQKQTERILRAMDNPYFNILGHATGRLLLKREGYELDIERVLKHAKTNGCLFEINSSPDRLDLSDEHAKLARDLGIKIAVNTDAHAIRELDFISAGINQARRAWLRPSDVINAMPLEKLRKLLVR